MKNLIKLSTAINLFRRLLTSFVLIYLTTPSVMASYTYITTGAGSIVKVNIDTGSTQAITSITPDVRGIACDNQGSIYLGTTWLDTSGYAKRVIKIIPQANGSAIIEPFTAPITSTYGTGQIGFNSKGELFVAGDTDQVVYKYDKNGNLTETLGFDGQAKNNVGLFVDGDILYSIGYFNPYKIIQYDTSSGTSIGGVIAQLQFPYDYCPTSITKSHTGNLAIGFSSVNHAGWTELWEYNLQTNTTHKLFDCSGPSGFSQYDPFTNTYLVGGTGLNIFDTQGNLIKTINNLEWGSVRLISGTFVPEPCTLLLLAVGGVMLRKR